MLHTGQPRSHGACTRPLRETRNEIRNTTPVHREEQVPACHSFEAAGWKCAVFRGQPRPTSNPPPERVPSRPVPCAKRLLPYELRCAVTACSGSLRPPAPTGTALNAQRRRASLRWRTEASRAWVRSARPTGRLLRPFAPPPPHARAARRLRLIKKGSTLRAIRSAAPPAIEYS